MDEYNVDDIISLFEDHADMSDEETSRLNNNINDDPVDDINDNESDTSLFPIFGIIKKVSTSNKLNDGRSKDKAELDEVKFQKQINLLSKGDQYSHSLISTDITMQKMYSFAGGGLTIENMISDSTWVGTDAIYVNVMFVSKNALNNINKFLQDIESRKDMTDYYTSGIIQQYIGKPAKDPNNFICSRFTGYVMQMADPKNLHRDYSRLRPEDVTILPRAFYVNVFKDGDDFKNNFDDFKLRISNIHAEHKDELLDYNNHLPKMLLKDKCRKLKTFDKLATSFLDKIFY